jgi:hypothetical protein
MFAQKAAGNTGALMVSRYDKYGGSQISQLFERGEGFVHQRGGDTASEKKIASVHHGRYALCGGSLESPAGVGKKILTAPPPLYSRLQGQVKAQMCV